MTLRAAGLMHDMAVTRDCAVLFDSSIVVELDGVLSGWFGHFDQLKPARLGAAPSALPLGHA